MVPVDRPKTKEQFASREKIRKWKTGLIFYLSLVSQLEPCGTNWIKTKEKLASREKIRKWKSGLTGRSEISRVLARNI